MKKSSFTLRLKSPLFSPYDLEILYGVAGFGGIKLFPVKILCGNPLTKRFALFITEIWPIASVTKFVQSILFLNCY